MPGKGKYTQYVPSDPAGKARQKFLESLFGGNNTGAYAVNVGDATQQEPPWFGLDQAGAVAVAAGIGNSVLRSASSNGIAQGDMSMFPNGVDLTFNGATADISVPDTHWAKAGSAGAGVETDRPGDPMNPYMPNVASPGPGKTAGTDKSPNPLDPALYVSQLDPNKTFDDKGVTQNTTSPSTTSGNVYAANALGAASTISVTSKEQFE